MQLFFFYFEPYTKVIGIGLRCRFGASSHWQNVKNRKTKKNGLNSVYVPSPWLNCTKGNNKQMITSQQFLNDQKNYILSVK